MPVSVSVSSLCAVIGKQNKTASTQLNSARLSAICAIFHPSSILHIALFSLLLLLPCLEPCNRQLSGNIPRTKHADKQRCRGYWLTREIDTNRVIFSETAQEEFVNQIGEAPIPLPAGGNKHFDPSKSATLKYIQASYPTILRFAEKLATINKIQMFIHEFLPLPN